MRIFITLCPTVAQKPRLYGSHFTVEWHKGVLNILSLMNAPQSFLWCGAYAKLCLGWTAAKKNNPGWSIILHSNSTKVSKCHVLGAPKLAPWSRIDGTSRRVTSGLCARCHVKISSHFLWPFLVHPSVRARGRSHRWALAFLARPGSGLWSVCTWIGRSCQFC